MTPIEAIITAFDHQWLQPDNEIFQQRDPIHKELILPRVRPGAHPVKARASKVSKIDTNQKIATQMHWAHVIVCVEQSHPAALDWAEALYAPISFPQVLRFIQEASNTLVQIYIEQGNTDKRNREKMKRISPYFLMMFAHKRLVQVAGKRFKSNRIPLLTQQDAFENASINTNSHVSYMKYFDWIKKELEKLEQAMENSVRRFIISQIENDSSMAS